MAVEAPAPVRTRPGATTRVVPALYVAAVLAQIGYPLASGGVRDAVTVAVVLLVAAAALTHAAATRGRRVLAALMLSSVVGGYAVEQLGVHTGVPFGGYRYGSGLGPSVAGVPLVIAFAWPMLAWPAALAARALTRPFGARVLVGAWALASWDLFLDPQMVAAGHWRWLDPSPHLPGVPHVPLGDYAGWFVIALAISFVVQTFLTGRHDGRPDDCPDDRWPLAFYVWTWASSVLALAAFLDLAAAAAWGGVAMGVVAVPLTRSRTRSR